MDAGTFNSGSDVGEAQVQKNEQTNDSYCAILLSVFRNNNSVCMDSVLIVTTTRSNFDSEVTCQDDDSQHTASNITSANTLPEMTSTDVKLMHVVNQTDLVAPSKNFTTHILTCRSYSNILWEINGNNVISFNENDVIGAHNFSLYHLNLSEVEWEAVIVHKEAPKIVSVMIWTDFDSVGSFRVTCRSRMDEATIAFNPHTTHSPTLTSTEVYSTNSTAAQSLRQNCPLL